MFRASSAEMPNPARHAASLRRRLIWPSPAKMTTAPGVRTSYVLSHGLPVATAMHTLSATS